MTINVNLFERKVSQAILTQLKHIINVYCTKNGEIHFVDVAMTNRFHHHSVDRSKRAIYDEHVVPSYHIRGTDISNIAINFPIKYHAQSIYTHKKKRRYLNSIVNPSFVDWIEILLLYAINAARCRYCHVSSKVIPHFCTFNVQTFLCVLYSNGIVWRWC